MAGEGEVEGQEHEQRQEAERSQAAQDGVSSSREAREIQRGRMSKTCMSKTGARIYTIANGQPFLETLAGAILSGDLPVHGGPAPDPMSLSDLTLLMPTRRAQRALGEAFLKLSGRPALLLPAIRPIADRDDDAEYLHAAASAGPYARGIDHSGASLAPAIDDVERQLLLTRLVMQWSAAMRRATLADPSPGGEGDVGVAPSAGARTPAQAAHLAGELARLMDLVETEGISLGGLKDLVPEQYAEHWQTTLKFLEIVTAYWPAHLGERGVLSPKDRRNRVLIAEAERLRAAPPPAPVIVAGVTGSIPATIDLMRAVMDCPGGAIVLPGLDTALDEESWNAIAPDHPEHPQFGLNRLLNSLGVNRGDVHVLGEACARAHVRNAFISEVMRPTGSTHKWRAFADRTEPAQVADALAGVSLVEAANAPEEAEAISLILREAAEDEHVKAALVTPDRILARRVATRLETWGIRVDDSAGRPFAKTVPGTFLDLVVTCVATDFQPADLMALLKHPLCRLGLAPREVRFAARALEVLALRDIYIGRGLGGLSAALARSRARREREERLNAAARRMREEHWAAAENLIDGLSAALAPISTMFKQGEDVSLGALAGAHAQAAEAVARKPDDDEGDETALDEPEQDGATASPLYAGEAGDAAAAIFARLMANDDIAPALRPADYPDLYRSLITGRNVLPRIPLHPRLSILGVFEARLLQADVVILGGLNDGVWPEPADPGPWLNRPMRRELGLPVPEETIGQAAHDFTALLGAGQVYLTRAKKVDGVPTVASRWLLRLQALLGGVGQRDAVRADQPWGAWAQERDAFDERVHISRPAPCPPVGVRPRQIGVSRVETWLSNPYAIYASRILRLEPLPPLGAAPDAALRGGVVHDVLSRFADAYPRALPDNAAQAFMDITDDVLTDYAGDTRVAAFWLLRLERFAHWFAETEPARRDRVIKSMAEVDGQLLVSRGAGEPFKLTARADRLDMSEGGLIVTDYKTGAAPQNNRVVNGAAPQLPLEAAIASAGGFGDDVRGPIAGLRYIRASGGDPAGEEQLVKCDDLEQLAASALRGLEQLVVRYDDPATPYPALRRAGFSYDYDDYQHLARVAEWSGQGDDGEGDTLP